MATMEDVAQRAGVAVSTVSYAINGTRPISPATRERVEQAMRELGYRPHAVARALASRRSRIIALALPAAQRGVGRTEIEFVMGAVDAAEADGYHLVIWPSEIAGQDDVEALSGHGLVDGVLLMEVRLIDERVKALTAEGRPLAMIGRTADPSGLAHVDIDFDHTLDQAVDLLVGLGHRRIAFINHDRAVHDSGYGPTIRAPKAFVRAMEQRNLKPVTRFCPDDPTDAEALAAELLAREPALTAAVVMNEPAIPGLLRALSIAGKRVPEDFSVISVVSSSEVARMSIPALTVAEAPSRELGRRGVELLLAVLDERAEEIVPELMPCRLVIGGSTDLAPG
jgi:DNA-binding LacI/PurR family transcriptional regulator